MIIKPMLDSWEIPSIESIRCLERRRFVRHGVPGLAGDLHQDLGSESLVVEIRGSLHGDEARDTFFEEIREKFANAEPLSFVADITTATDLEQVIIEDLEVREDNDFSRPFRYRIVLRQYVEPPEPVSSFDDFGAELDPDLDLLAGLGLDGLELPDLLIDIPEIGNPVEPILPALDSTDAAVFGITDVLGQFREKFTS